MLVNKRCSNYSFILHVLLIHVGGDVHVQLGAGDELVQLQHILGAGLKVRGGVVGLGDVAVVLLAVAHGLQQVRHRVEAVAR